MQKKWNRILKRALACVLVVVMTLTAVPLGVTQEFKGLGSLFKGFVTTAKAADYKNIKIDVDILDGASHQSSDQAQLNENGEPNGITLYYIDADGESRLTTLPISENEFKESGTTKSFEFKLDSAASYPTSVYQDDIVTALGHTEFTDLAVAATCTETGLTQGSHCSVCGEVFVAQKVVSALGHTYGEYAVTIQPTCTKTGVETKTCFVCGDKQTRPVGFLLVCVTGSPQYTASRLRPS